MIKLNLYESGLVGPLPRGTQQLSALCTATRSPVPSLLNWDSWGRGLVSP